MCCVLMCIDVLCVCVFCVWCGCILWVVHVYVLILQFVCAYVCVSHFLYILFFLGDLNVSLAEIDVFHNEWTLTEDRKLVLDILTKLPEYVKNLNAFHSVKNLQNIFFFNLHFCVFFNLAQSHNTNNHTQHTAHTQHTPRHTPQHTPRHTPQHTSRTHVSSCCSC